MKKKIKTFLGFSILFFCRIIKNFVDFQFCHLYTSRIGHQTVNFDIALLSVKKNTVILCSNDKKIANKFILNFFKKQNKVFFSPIFKYFYHLILFANKDSEFIISWKQYQPEFSFHLNTKGRITFPKFSKQKLDTIFSKYQITENFVGLFSRNPLYIKKNNLNDQNFHDYRDFEFKDFELAIEYLKKDNSLVKLGDTYPEENFEYSGAKILTSLDYNSDQEIDYILNAYSRYNVMGDSGISGISSILRKKIIYINFIPLNINHLSYCSPGSIILPKKIYDKKKERFLTFTENLNLNFSLHNISDPYKDRNLEVINNSPKEILDVVIEMEEQLKGIKNKDGEELNEIFWKKIAKKDLNKVNFLRKDLKLSVSNNFLKENINLI